MPTKYYKAIWYNAESVVCEDGPFEAVSKSAAEFVAYTRFKGNPPAPLLSIVEVSGGNV